MESLLSHAKFLNNIESNIYFRKLLKNPTPKSFVKSQESFIDAVNEWSNLLSHLLTKVPSYKERLPIIENLMDEHGEGDLERSHVETFRKFINSFKTRDNLQMYNKESQTYHIIEEFYRTLDRDLKYYSWEYSAAMLGMIEYTYITVSTVIHQYAKQHIPEEEIYHYTLHETLDTKHSEDLFRIIVPYLDQNNNSNMVKLGLQKGYNTMYKMYKELSNYLEISDQCADDYL